MLTDEANPQCLTLGYSMKKCESMSYSFNNKQKLNIEQFTCIPDRRFLNVF